MYGEVAALGPVVQGRDLPEPRYYGDNEELQKKVKTAQAKLAGYKPGLAAASFLLGRLLAVYWTPMGGTRNTKKARRQDSVGGVAKVGRVITLAIGHRASVHGFELRP